MAERDGDGYVAACFELGAVATGETIDEAFQRLDEAVRVQLQALEEADQRERVFRENAVEVVESIEDAAAFTQTLDGGKVMRVTRYQLPREHQSF